MDILWQFISSILSPVISTLIIKLIELKMTQRPNNWLLLLGSTLVALFIAGIFFISSPFIINIIHFGKIDIVAESVRNNVFGQQTDGKTFIGTTYEIMNKLNPENYESIHVVFDINNNLENNPNNQLPAYFLVIGDDFENSVPLIQGHSGGGVTYTTNDNTDIFDVPIALFPQGNLNFKHISILTPWVPSENGSKLISFKIQKILLLPKP